MSLKKRRTFAIGAAVALAALAAGVGWRLVPGEQAQTTAVSQGEVDLRVSGPGTVPARVPVSVSAGAPAARESIERNIAAALFLLTCDI